MKRNLPNDNDRRVTSWLNSQIDSTGSSNGKDNLWHDIIAKVATMAKSQLISILQSGSLEPIHSQGHYKLNVRKADYNLF